jgi:hypothetical protein
LQRRAFDLIAPLRSFLEEWIIECAYGSLIADNKLPGMAVGFDRVPQSISSSANREGSSSPTRFWLKS